MTPATNGLKDGAFYNNFGGRQNQSRTRRPCITHEMRRRFKVVRASLATYSKLQCSNHDQ